MHLSFFGWLSGEFQCSEEAVTVAAMSQIQNVFVTPSGQKHASVSKIRKFGHYRFWKSRNI